MNQNLLNKKTTNNSKKAVNTHKSTRHLVLSLMHKINMMAYFKLGMISIWVILKKRMSSQMSNRKSKTIIITLLQVTFSPQNTFFKILNQIFNPKKYLMKIWTNLKTRRRKLTIGSENSYCHQLQNLTRKANNIFSANKKLKI